ncbi:hypothetical protein [Herbaspirillum rubrisubalbicans]|uniref:Uncharacterized protein n=1 Tax=Herbaspirillum rubrisubalbicans TaxID=80842 RepID=A0AAD0U719_9BURK|nr:hypothetical protein [Herbaspirillum rubrisubalbicans]AYR23037.1 hypothetical protein RC54_04025 [Herbaspirillum rubrisubalbicans]
MSDTKVIDTKLALAWLAPLGVTIVAGLITLVWMAAQQTSTINTLLETQREMKAQMGARDQRDEAFKAAQITAIAEVKLNDARQDIRIENLEKAVGAKPPPLGKWTK